MIFAAGLGTRLKPLTDTLPKALVPVGGRPLIEHICRKLIKTGITEAVVNVHHFADKIEEWAAQQDWVLTSKEQMTASEKTGKILIEFSDERKSLLETGGGILHARKYLEGCGNFLIHNVDILSNADLVKLEHQVKPDALATLLVSDRKASRYFLFHPETMRLVGWLNPSTGETIMTDPSIKPEDCKRLGFSGIHIMSDRVFNMMDEYIKETATPVVTPTVTPAAQSPTQISDPTPATTVDAKFPIRDFYLWAAGRTPIYGVVAPNLELIDVGKLDTIEFAEFFLKQI